MMAVRLFRDPDSRRRTAAFAACTLLLLSGCGGKSQKSSSEKPKSASSSSSSVSSALSSSASSPPPKSAVSAQASPKTVSGANEKILTVRNGQTVSSPNPGSEVTAAAILLDYFGYAATRSDLLAFLPSDGNFYEMNGRQYGPNPWKTFAGNPGTNRYGCYAPVISNMLNSYLLLSDGKHTAYNLTGLSTDKLYKCVDAGLPVIVWVTESMAEPSIEKSWCLVGTDQTCRWVDQDHCMLLIGHTQTKAVFSDPNSSAGTVSYDRSLFEERYRQLYSQAVAMQ